MSSKKETAAVVTAPVTLTSKYSNRVLLKTILQRSDGGLGLVGERVVVGGWVKSSKEVKKEPVAQHGEVDVLLRSKDKDKDKDVSCVEMLQSRIPFFRTIIRVLAGGGGSGSNSPLREKLDSIISKPLPPAIAFLQVSDGSCVLSIQVMVDSAIVAPSKLLPTGTCILAEGVLEMSSVQGKPAVQLRAEKLLHIGTVEHDQYPLSKKRLPLDSLRDFSHFRARTTTVASVMHIRSALTFATHEFFQSHEFFNVQAPVITTTDAEGFSDKFHVTTLFDEADKHKLNTNDTEGISLATIKDAMKEKSSLVEELKRSQSNKEALAAAVKDLQKTNILASQLEAKENFKKAPTLKNVKIDFSEDFFSHEAFLTVSGRLHLESYACALGNVYTFGPRFRAERKEHSKQAAEMWMVEVEMAFTQLEDAMNCAEDYFKSLCKWTIENCSREEEFVAKRIDKDINARLLFMISTSFEKIAYIEALKLLEKVTDRTFETKLEWGVALTREHQSYLADEIYKKPIIIYDHPKAAKPFYVRLNDDGKTVAAFDMIVPKVGPVIAGSQNEERYDILSTSIMDLGLPKEQYEWYLELRRNGTVKHSGFSLGFDLMVLICTGLTDVKDAIPFPRSLGKVNN